VDRSLSSRAPPHADSSCCDFDFKCPSVSQLNLWRDLRDDMRAFHAKLNAIKRDEIAARHIRLGNPTLASYVSRQQRRGSVMDAN